jgi:hypothetical protein
MSKKNASERSPTGEQETEKTQKTEYAKDCQSMPRFRPEKATGARGIGRPKEKTKMDGTKNGG